MLTSLEQLFSDNQALSGAGAAASTNYIDLGAPGTVLGAPVALKRDIGKGKPIPLVIRLTAAPGGTNPTLDVDVEVDDNTSFSSAKIVASAIQKAPGVLGDEVYLPVYLPEGTDERYLRLNYTLGGTSPTYTVWAGIVAAKPSNPTVPGA